MEQNLLTNLINRMQSESPVLFKWMMKGAIALIVPLAIFWALLHYQVLVIPNGDNIQKMLLASGGVLVGVVVTSSATTNDPKLMDPKTIGNVVDHVSGDNSPN